MERTIYPIRAHHGMCLTFFQGKGYSGPFVDNMTQMKLLLEQDPLICLRDSPDAICRACPNRLTQDCAEKAVRYDRAVLERCGLEVGQTLPYRRFAQQVREYILRPGHREEICGDCQWSSLCQWREDNE